jgi:DNA-binding MarR family transcriptional regulator
LLIAFLFAIFNSDLMEDPLTSLPGYSLRRAANAASAELAQRLSALGLRQSDASLLMLVAANPGVTASALGRQLDIQRANMVPILKRLEDAGLITRAPIDGKSQGLALAEAGRTTLAEARTVIERFERELIERVPAEHRAHLLPALDAIWR